MDAAAVETWLGSIASLTDAQRRRASLALGPPGGVETTDIERRKWAMAEPAWPARNTATSPSLGEADTPDVANIGGRKVAVTGCPHCGQSDVVRWGRASGLPRYRCKACVRTFNALTKTPLAKLRMKEKWSRQADAMIDGVSITKAAGRCGVHYTTAFRWRHRFLAALSGDKPKTLAGIVESDETFILESFKASDPACPGRRANAVAARPSGVCPPNRSRSSSPAIAKAPQRMRCCQD